MAQLLPTLSTIQYTVVNYKLTQARDAKSPWWQRAYIDVLLALVAAYGYYLLQAQGGTIRRGRRRR